jgi:hypothetical protein
MSCNLNILTVTVRLSKQYFTFLEAQTLCNRYFLNTQYGNSAADIMYQLNHRLYMGWSNGDMANYWNIWLTFFLATNCLVKINFSQVFLCSAG